MTKKDDFRSVESKCNDMRNSQGNSEIIFKHGDFFVPISCSVLLPSEMRLHVLTSVCMWICKIQSW